MSIEMTHENTHDKWNIVKRLNFLFSGFVRIVLLIFGIKKKCYLHKSSRGVSKQLWSFIENAKDFRSYFLCIDMKIRLSKLRGWVLTQSVSWSTHYWLGKLNFMIRQLTSILISMVLPFKPGTRYTQKISTQIRLPKMSDLICIQKNYR